MDKKIIIFDVDGVITDSGQSKESIIQAILERHNLFELPGVGDIFGIGLNRIVLLDKIYAIQPFDRDVVLDQINTELSILESNVSLIPDTFEFIKANYQKYIFFTNTSLPKKSLVSISSNLGISKYFQELLAYDDGTKKENIEYILDICGVTPENVLFIDDKQSHIERVKNTHVQTLLFKQDGVSLQQKVNKIF